MVLSLEHLPTKSGYPGPRPIQTFRFFTARSSQRLNNPFVPLKRRPLDEVVSQGFPGINKDFLMKLGFIQYENMHTEPLEKYLKANPDPEWVKLRSGDERTSEIYFRVIVSRLGVECYWFEKYDEAYLEDYFENVIREKGITSPSQFFSDLGLMDFLGEASSALMVTNKIIGVRFLKSLADKKRISDIPTLAKFFILTGQKYKKLREKRSYFKDIALGVFPGAENRETRNELLSALVKEIIPDNPGEQGSFFGSSEDFSPVADPRSLEDFIVEMAAHMHGVNAQENLRFIIGAGQTLEDKKPNVPFYVKIARQSWPKFFELEEQYLLSLCRMLLPDDQDQQWDLIIEMEKERHPDNIPEQSKIFVCALQEAKDEVINGCLLRVKNKVFRDRPLDFGLFAAFVVQGVRVNVPHAQKTILFRLFDRLSFDQEAWAAINGAAHVLRMRPPALLREWEDFSDSESSV